MASRIAFCIGQYVVARDFLNGYIVAFVIGRDFLLFYPVKEKKLVQSILR